MRYDIEQLKKRSIIDVANDLGIALKRNSEHVWELEDHDSFKIFTQTNTFKWFSRDMYGTVIDFVQLHANVDFVTAMNYLANNEFTTVKKESYKREPFRYYLQPYESQNLQKSLYYLTEVRGLSKQTVADFLKRGLISQAKQKNGTAIEEVLVFKYFNTNRSTGKSSLEGAGTVTLSYDKAFKSEKKIMRNSDGMLGLSFDVGKPNRLIFFEAPIDLMSYYELHKHQLSNVRLVAMDGLKKAIIARYSLELIGELKGKPDYIQTVERTAIPRQFDAVANSTKFFEENPNFITLAVDNDQAGRDFSNKLLQQNIPIKKELPNNLGLEKMDWNDLLKIQRSQQQSLVYQPTKHQVRQTVEM